MIMICEALKNEIKTITVWLHQLCMCPPFVFPSKTRGRVKCGSTCNIIFQVDVFTFRAFTVTFCVFGGRALCLLLLSSLAPHSVAKTHFYAPSFVPFYWPRVWLWEKEDALGAGTPRQREESMLWEACECVGNSELERQVEAWIGWTLHGWVNVVSSAVRDRIKGFWRRAWEVVGLEGQEDLWSVLILLYFLY